MTAEAVTHVWLVLAGPCMGSFLAAFAGRTCRGASVARGRSRCQSCGARISPQDLVPILSYLLLRGRCRSCSAPIPRGLVIVELAGGALAVLAILRGGPLVEEACGAVFLWCLLGLYLCDRACFRLPDALTLPLLGSGLVVGTMGATGDLRSALMGAALGCGVMWLVGTLYLRLRRRPGLGAGDVKMMAGIGAAVGPLLIAWVTLLASAVALLDAALLAGGFRLLEATQRIAFGSFLALAGGAVWLLGGLIG
jgi:leader peptidase (prepilin peptidase)/N-methyltransferase